MNSAVKLLAVRSICAFTFGLLAHGAAAAVEEHAAAARLVKVPGGGSILVGVEFGSDLYVLAGTAGGGAADMLLTDPERCIRRLSELLDRTSPEDGEGASRVTCGDSQGSLQLSRHPSTADHFTLTVSYLTLVDGKRVPFPASLALPARQAAEFVGALRSAQAHIDANSISVRSTVDRKEAAR